MVMKKSIISKIVDKINTNYNENYKICSPAVILKSETPNKTIQLKTWVGNDIEPSKNSVYYLTGEGESKNAKNFPISEAINEAGKQGKFDLIIAIERIEISEKGTLSQLTFPNNIFSEYFEDGEKDFKKFDVLNRDELSQQFTALFIKIPICEGNPNNAENIVEVDNVYYDITNLLTYLTIADSRTYKNFVYSTPILKADAAETRPDVTVDWAHNMLVHGAPGTGKSFTVNKKATEKFGKNVRRVTFYEDYSYEKFVGAYMPVQDVKTTKLSFDDKKGCAEGEGIAYKFKPGIMANILAEAYAELIIAKNKSYFDNHQNDKENNTDQDQSFSLSELYKINDDEVKPQEFCLIVEEINRAPAASVFGDFFQLLDRDKNGLSTYSISISDEFKDWFVDRVTELCKKHYDNSTDASIFEIARKTTELVADNLRLPPNLYIWTTMNSADQGVFPLDTAFKRRWCYMYMSVDKNRETEMKIKIPYNSKINEINWDFFRNAINAAIQAAGCIEEDRLIGTWYFNDNDFAANDKLFDNFNKTDVNKRYSMINPLCDKLFAYLRNDVFRNNPESFFSKEYTTMSKIREGIVNGISLGVIIKNFSIAESAPSGSDSANTSGNGETPAQSPEITTTQAENQTSGE